MDDTYNAIAGDQPAPQKPGFDPTKTYGTPSQILDNLKEIESSGDAFALNKDTKAMGNYQFTPETARMLNKQGIKFNSYDPQEARAAADYYLNSLYQRTGSWEKALAAYGGFNKKDSTAYVNAAMKGVDQPLNISVTTTAKAPYSDDPIFQAISGTGYDAGSISPSAIPGANPNTPVYQNAPAQEPTALDKYVIGPLAAGTSIAANTIATPIANLYGILKEIAKGELGNGKNMGAKYAEEAMGGGFTPTSPGGQAAMSQFNKWFEESKLAGLGPPEAAMLARTPTPTEIQQGIGLMSESPVRPAVKVAPSATETGLPAGLRQTVRGEAPAQPVGNVGAETKVAPEATPANEVATGEIAPGQSVNLTNADMQSRAEVLQRVGQDTARRSAIEADPLQAATEAQMTRHNEPAGQASLNQFTHEKDALENYTSNLIDRMGGTQGMDEASLHQIGQTISKPFDSLRGWFKTSIDNLYNEANKVAGNIPLTDLPNTKSLLSDPTFQNTAFAKGQRELVNSIDSQLKHFIEKNNGELSVQNAEQYRQWLNTIWSPDNSRLIRQVQDALDQDVFSHAGSDIYQTSRKLYELRIKTLDDPKGIAKMFEFDPQTPLNRTTPFNKIPNSLLNLDPDQFEHIVGVLKDMPSDLQPEAQAALGEIKSQFLNKILDAGTQTGGTPSKFWKFRDVNKFFKANTAKMPMVFSPEEMEEIKDIQRAGNINGSDTNYPGTAASVSNAIKAGLMSRALTKVSAAAGAAAGGLAGGVFGPTGGAAGSAAGAAAGEGFGVRQAEKAAQKSFGKKLVPLSEIGK